MTSPSQPFQVILFSYPRTACHLLERMLSMQPGTLYLSHPIATARRFQARMLSEESVGAGIPDEMRTGYLQAIKEGVGAWQKALTIAENAGKTLFIHEHPHFALHPNDALSYLKSPQSAGSNTIPKNCTTIPDSLLLHPGSRPILTIRHPALTVPAAYRAMKAIEGTYNRSNVLISGTQRWQCELYDWFVSNGITPIVADADDYMASREFVRKLASEAGLDPESCTFEWEKVDEDAQKGMHGMYVKLQQTLLNSEGIVEGKAMRVVDVDSERQKWEQEFESQEVEFLNELIDLTMEHFEYLRARKLKLDIVQS